MQNNTKENSQRESIRELTKIIPKTNTKKNSQREFIRELTKRVQK